ncbi:MAG: YHS domain-containing protein [Ramlibacter sp.]|nr:YHS domain-containing protein [Ramlibacter sp.]MBX3658143.1 YHS domain-containing protein [Ramlibacter sp.]MCW5648562.1 YHS domain-containing protein [Ramlibacter sp.]
MTLTPSSSLRALLAALVLAAAGPAAAAEPVSTSFLGHTAIGGKDTVSYHTPQARQAHQVTEGQAQYTVKYLGADWHFASRASADQFAANPAAYAPRYNGFCANALSTGEGLVRTDGSVWEFFGGKLYLFYGERGRQRWLAGDWKAYQQQADAAWQAESRK